MSFLFYFGKQNSLRGINFCKIFITEFAKLANENIFIFTESKYDKVHLSESLTSFSSIKIINIYGHIKISKSTELDNENLISKRYKDFNFNRLLYIDHLNIKQKRNNLDFIINHILYYETFLNNHKIKFVHFGINQTSRSLGMSILYLVLRKYNIPLFMVAKTPIKGRNAVYDDICYTKIEGFEEEYINVLKAGISQSIKQSLDVYFQVYKEFKQKWHNPMLFAQRRKRKSLSFKKIRTNLARAKNIYCSLRYKTYVNDYNSKRPYVLFLINKNNWLADSFLPYYSDIFYLTKYIWMSLPLGYDLIIKDHPLISFPDKERISLYKLAKELPNFYYLSGDYNTDELVEKAGVVLFNCSTSGVEALMKFKQVIVFGEHPIFFNFGEPPVHKLTNIEHLPELIKKCLSMPVSREKIYAYFYLLLKYSENFSGESDINKIEHVHNFKNMGSMLYKKIKKKQII